MTQRLIIDCSTGQETYVDLTPEEETELLARQAAAAQTEIDERLGELMIVLEA